MCPLSWAPCAGFHTLESLVTIMLIHEDIIWEQTTLIIAAHRGRPRGWKAVGSALFWVSLGWYGWGAKLKLVIWELCGSSRRADGSPDMVVTEWGRLVLKENRLWPEEGQWSGDLLLISLLRSFGVLKKMTGQGRKGVMVSKEALARCLKMGGVCGAVRCGTVRCVVVTGRHTAAGCYVLRDKTGDR